MHSTRSKPSASARCTPSVTAADWPCSAVSSIGSAPCSRAVAGRLGSRVTTIVSSIEAVCASACSTAATTAPAQRAARSCSTLSPSRDLAAAKRLTGRIAAVRIGAHDSGEGLPPPGAGSARVAPSDLPASPAEQHQADGHTRPDGDGQAALAGVRFAGLDRVAQDVHDRRRADVAVLGEHAPAQLGLLLVEIERGLDVLDDPPPAGVHDPVVDLLPLQAVALKEAVDAPPQSGARQVGQLAGEVQVAVAVAALEFDGAERAGDLVDL